MKQILEDNGSKVMTAERNETQAARPSNQTTLFSKPITEVGVYRVEDIQKILGIGKNKAYDLMKSGQFPVIKIGNMRLVSWEIFREWMNMGGEI